MKERFFHGSAKPLKETRVFVMGIGSHDGGMGSIRFFASLGYNVIAADLKTKSQLSHILPVKPIGNVMYRFGEHRKADLQSSDLLIKNSAIPLRHPFHSIAKNTVFQ